MALSNPKPCLSYLVSLCVTGMSGLVFIQVTTSWLHEPGELSTAASLGSCQEKDNLGTAKARQIPQAWGPQKKSTGDSCGPSSRALRSLKCYLLQKEAPRCGPGFAVYELYSWANGIVSVVFMMRADVELLCQRFPCQLTQFRQLRDSRDPPISSRSPSASAPSPTPHLAPPRLAVSWITNRMHPQFPTRVALPSLADLSNEI